MNPSSVFPIVQSYKFKSKSQPSPSGCFFVFGCFRQFKVTNSKANHNRAADVCLRSLGVSDSSKLQIQKQITTQRVQAAVTPLVFPIVQSYKFKSKSQPPLRQGLPPLGVSDSSKLQIQKQITTSTSLKSQFMGVFPIVQSYKFKSKSQRTTSRTAI